MALRSASSPNACCQWRGANPSSWTPPAARYATTAAARRRVNPLRRCAIGRPRTSTSNACRSVCSAIAAVPWGANSMRRVRRCARMRKNLVTYASAYVARDAVHRRNVHLHSRTAFPSCPRASVVPLAMTAAVSGIIVDRRVRDSSICTTSSSAKRNRKRKRRQHL